MFLLVSVLLIDLPARWYTSPLLLAILCAGEIGDATVRYVAVPAVVAVCGYRVVAARKVRTGDAANALAAAASVPLASVVRAVMLHFGAYQMVAPKTAISRPQQWPHNAALAWHALRVLFGVEIGSGSPSPARTAGYILGLACLLAAAAGFARVVWTWRTASRAEQLLCAAIVINLSMYVISTMPIPSNPYEVVAVLPCGAVLAARACVPGHIVGTLRAAWQTAWPPSPHCCHWPPRPPGPPLRCRRRPSARGSRRTDSRTASPATGTVRLSHWSQATTCRSARSR